MDGDWNEVDQNDHWEGQARGAMRIEKEWEKMRRRARVERVKNGKKRSNVKEKEQPVRRDIKPCI